MGARIGIILMDCEVTKIRSSGEAEFSPIQLTEEVLEILRAVSAACRITPIFQKLKCSGLEVLRDLITAFSQ